MCNVVFMISGKHFRIAFSIHSPSLENCTDTRVTVAATSHACSPYAEICVIILQPNSILCFSSQHILRGEGLSGWYKQPIVFFPLLTCLLNAFPLCDIPLCGGREAERARWWVQEHALQTAYIKISAEPSHAKSSNVSSYTPIAPQHAGCLLNWYVVSRTHKKGGNSAFFVQQ